jgi:hypothetical protein
MWIGTEGKGCCHHQIERAMRIGKDVRGNFHDQYEVQCGLEQMIQDDVLT